MQLFYTPDISANTKEFTFSKEESKHLTKVLRKKEGSNIHITNGRGYLFEGSLITADTKQCVATIHKATLQDQKKYSLHLAVAPTKINDRYEWFLEKATEIGIDEITPIICDHSERKVIKAERFQKILQTAMKQSLNCYLPKLNEAISFKQFVTKTKANCFIAHCEEESKKSLKESIIQNTNTTILIGPEGDFSPQEIALAKENNYIPISLGNTRLRTETAAIVACHSVAFVNE